MLNITANSSRATAILGAVAMTTACFFVASSPARAAAFETQVEQRINVDLREGALPTGSGKATLAVTLDDAGTVTRTEVVKSSGNAALDARAVRTATTIRYPAGSARTFAMVLGFRVPVTSADRATGAMLVKALSGDRQLVAGGDASLVG